MTLSGRTIAITGGSSGLGLAVAQRAATRGARLELIARDPAKLDRAAGSIAGPVRTWPLDVADEDALAAAFAAIGQVDCLLACAGVLTEGRFDEQPAETFRAMIETNLFGTVNCVRAALPHLRAPGGSIAIVSSLAGRFGVYGYTAYAASKHALVGFAESLRYELEPRGISVNLICPGEFDSPMVDELDRHRSPENRSHVLLIPKRELGAIADAVIDAIERDRPVAYAGARAHAAVLLANLFPGVTRRAGRLAIRRART